LYLLQFCRYFLEVDIRRCSLLRNTFQAALKPGELLVTLLLDPD
jgi:hypothetical protein